MIHREEDILAYMKEFASNFFARMDVYPIFDCNVTNRL